MERESFAGRLDLLLVTFQTTGEGGMGDVQVGGACMHGAACITGFVPETCIQVERVALLIVHPSKFDCQTDAMETDQFRGTCLTPHAIGKHAPNSVPKIGGKTQRADANATS
jgi:hypothetical protein